MTQPPRKWSRFVYSAAGFQWGFGSCLTKIVHVLAVISVLILAIGLSPQSSSPIYLDPQQPIERRVDDLMSRMTLKEKVGQLNLPCVYVDQLGKSIPEKLEACKRFAAGTYTNEIGPGAGFFTLADTILHKGTEQQIEYFNSLQEIALTQTRLKIPILEDEEGTHGGMFSGATVFPEGLAIGSSFDMPLTEAIYAAAARESRAVGIHVLSTLVLELDRDPRMGRNEEGYTEDSYLGSRVAEAIVRGAQGQDISAPDKVVALMTDFPTQSEPMSGLERGAITLSAREIRENVLPPWKAAITKNGALGVMAGYPEIEDVPAHASKKWMNDVLRQELGFKGIVVSEGDGFDTLIYEGIVPTQKEAGVLALNAGVDVDITYEPAYMGPLIENVQEGRVPIELIDRAVRRVLELKFRLGLFEHPYVDLNHAKQVMHSSEHQRLALDAAHEGIVLLKNERNLLPLKKKLKTIAVIGPNADSASNLFGDYSAQVVSQHVNTILDAIKSKVSPATAVVYAKGCAVNDQNKSGFQRAIQAAKGADVAVLVMGEQSRREGDEAKNLPAPTDGEGYDVASLDLTGVQEELVEAIEATGTPTVLVLVNGRPLSTRWEADHLPAIVEAWQPGEAGGDAVADVLFGDYNPSGRLPITIPRSVGQLPAYYNYKLSKSYWIDGGWTHTKGYVDMPGTPLYPFGYGLSYTQFQYSNLHVEPSETHGETKVNVDIENTGKRAGVETVQLYVRERFTPVATPVRQLRGFERVALNPGEKKTVTFTLGPDDLQLLDQDMRWKVVPGTFDIMIGRSSADIVAKGALNLKP